MKQLQTFEDACKIEGLDPQKVLPEYEFLPEELKKHLHDYTKIIIIVAAANRVDNNGKTWVPDFSNSNERKFELWFQYRSEEGSSGFRFDGDGGWGAYSRVGSRLCFKKRETAKYIAKQFEELYNKYLSM